MCALCAGEMVMYGLQILPLSMKNRQPFRTPNNKQQTTPFPIPQPFPLAANREQQQLLSRIDQLQRELAQVSRRADELQAINGKLNRIIVSHHTDHAQPFISRFTRILENRPKQTHQEKGKSPLPNRASLATKRETSKGRKMQHTFSNFDQNNSMIGNLPMASQITREDVKRKLANNKPHPK